MLRLLVALVLLEISHAYVRLPKDVWPLSYHLRIQPSFDNLQYKGNLSIALVMNGTQEFFLDCEDLEISGTSMAFNEGWTVEHSYEQNSTRLRVRTNLIMPPTYNITFNVTFSGRIRKDLSGFYVSEYKYNGINSILGSTQFESMGARKAFPCFDEPSFPANFLIEFLLDPKWKAITNAPLVLDEISGGVRHSVFAMSRKMPTYLVAWVIYDESTFGNTSATLSSRCGTVNYSIWSSRQFSNQTRTALQAAPVLVEHLENYTGVACDAVRDKMDLVAVPDFSAGAMENWGLITFRESYLVEDNFSTALDKQLIISVVAHELAHQWFGNLVTPDWWNFVWLSEGFARYLQYLIPNQADHEMRMMEQFVVSTKQSVMSEDSSSARPLTAGDLNRTSDIEDMFDTITYDKGASILHMWSSLIGDNFLSGLNLYLNAVKRLGGVTFPEFLLMSLPSLPEGTKVWTETGGYPIVVVQDDAGSIILRQIKVTGWNSTSPSDWLIPITINSNGTIYTYHLQPNQTLHLPMDSDYIVNFNQTGYYRVHYENPKHWMAENVNSLTRSQLIDDSMALASFGLLPYSLAMKILEHHLKADNDYIVWVTGLRAMTAIGNDVKGSQLEDSFKAKMLDLMNGVVNFIAFNRTDTLSHLMKLQQMQILKHACHFGHAKCHQAAKELITNMSNVSPEIRNALLCTSVKIGNSTTWELLWHHYKTSTSPVFQKLLLQSLACTSDTSIISRFQNLIISGNIRRQDARPILSLLSSSPDGAQLTVTLLRKNYSQIYNYFNETRSINKILSAAVNHINETHLSEIKALATERKELDIDRLVPKIEKSINMKKMRMIQLYSLFDNNTNTDNNHNDSNNNSYLLSSTIISYFIPIIIYILTFRI